MTVRAVRRWRRAGAGPIEGERGMDKGNDHVRELEIKINALSDALAHLGQGRALQELLRIIRFPGYTTPAEFVFSSAILDAMQAQVSAVDKLGQDLLAGARLVAREPKEAG
jgi:hypothetical protein